MFSGLISNVTLTEVPFGAWITNFKLTQHIHTLGIPEPISLHQRPISLIHNYEQRTIRRLCKTYTTNSSNRVPCAWPLSEKEHEKLLLKAKEEGVPESERDVAKAGSTLHSIAIMWLSEDRQIRIREENKGNREKKRGALDPSHHILPSLARILAVEVPLAWFNRVQSLPYTLFTCKVLIYCMHKLILDFLSTPLLSKYIPLTRCIRH